MRGNRTAGTILVLVCLLSPLLLIAGGAAQANGVAINFGSYTAPNAMTRTVAVLIPIPCKGTETLELWMEQDFVDEEQGLRLDGSRLAVDTQHGTYTIGTEPSAIELEGLLEDHGTTEALPALISCTVLPEDAPGTYRGTLRLRSEGSCGQEEDRINLKLTVNPWVTIESQTEFLLITRMDDVLGRLHSSFPGLLRISANAPWELSVQSEENILISESQLAVELLSGRDSRFSPLKTEPVEINDEAVPLATGQETWGEDTGSIEVPFHLRIRDYTQLPAGQVRFPVIFEVKLLE